MNSAAEWFAEQGARERAQGPYTMQMAERGAGRKAYEARLKEAQKHDSVNHPGHYTAGGIECIEAIKAATEGLQGIQAVCAANAIKYVWRFSRKNGAEDVRKAIWYLERLLREIDGGGGAP